MPKSWICLALRHQNAKLEIRERYGLHDAHRTVFLASLKHAIFKDLQINFEEDRTSRTNRTNRTATKNLEDNDAGFVFEQSMDIWCLITCNRCEIYLEYEENDLKECLPHRCLKNASSSSPLLVDTLINHLQNSWAELLKLDPKEKEIFKAHLNIFTGLDVVAHLFEVACGLDSMNLGETQITRQIKQQIQQHHAARAASELTAATARKKTPAFEFLINKSFVPRVFIVVCRQHCNHFFYKLILSIRFSNI